MRQHLRFRNIRTQATDATAVLFNSHPWAEDSDFVALANEWATSMASAYETDPVTVELQDSGFPQVSIYRAAFDSPDGENGARIVLVSKSLYKLFSLFGQHLVETGKLRNRYRISQGFGASLYYLVKPKMFRRMVREGRLPFDPYSIYTDATAGELRAYGISPNRADALTALREAQESGDALFGTPPDLTDELDGGSSEIAQNLLAAMNTRELRREATARGLTGTWNMNKAQLLDALGVRSDVEADDDDDGADDFDPAEDEGYEVDEDEVRGEV